MAEVIQRCSNTCVGMIVRNGDKILLIERKKFPFGFAPPAGHVDDDESFDDAAKREIGEEVGLKAESLKLLIEGRKDTPCRRPGGSWHYWKIYEVKTSDFEVSRSKSETKNANWYSMVQICSLAKKTELYLKNEIDEEMWQKSPGIELVWYDCLKELKII